MKDFHFKGGDFVSYKATCKAAKKFGIKPEENPREDYVERLQGIIERCLRVYLPTKGELKLIGVYLYKDWEQEADLQNTFGYTPQVTEDYAIIGISYSLLAYEMPAFQDLVFLHECCHLYERSHGERFQTRFNDVMFDYYYQHEIRMDGKRATVKKPDRKGWKM